MTTDRTLNGSSDLSALLSRQDGVVSRRQLLDLGLAPHDVRRLVRRRELTPVLPGVYVNHTGTPTWRERAWAAVLAVEPGVLWGQSALRAEAGPGWRGCADSDPIHVAVDLGRRPRLTEGIVVHRVANLDRVARWNLGPPRATIESATLEVACALADPADAIEALAASVRARCTTPQRLIEALAKRPRASHRRLLNRLLRDLRDGTCSALEHSYVYNVERPHGLPVPRRQWHERGRFSVYRDGYLKEFGAVLELDGQAFHDTPGQHALDLDRDLEVAAEGRFTIRLGWRQCTRDACRTASRVGAILQARGWIGAPIPCGPGCAVGQASAA